MKGAKLRIRPYRPADRDFLIRSLEGLQDHTIPLDPFDDLIRRKGFGEAWARETVRFVRKHRGRVFVAETGERAAGPVGFVSACVRPKNKWQALGTRPLRHGSIMDIYVIPDARGKGVGTALMHVAEHHLVEQGCNRIWLNVFAPNTRAHTLYRSLGYRDVNIQMLKRARRRP